MSTLRSCGCSASAGMSGVTGERLASVGRQRRHAAVRDVDDEEVLPTPALDNLAVMASHLRRLIKLTFQNRSLGVTHPDHG